MRASIVAVLVGAGCSGATAKHSAVPELRPADTDHARMLAGATAPSGRTWRVGVGVTGCALGATIATCEAALGPATVDPANVQLTAFAKAGVEVFVDDATVVRVFVRYQHAGVAAFVGSDPGGIGAGAAPAQITYAYGPPTSERDGNEADLAVHILEYADRALAFSFHDGRLASVTIAATTAAPTSPAASLPVPTPSPIATAPTCPVTWLRATPPAVATFTTVAAAKVALTKGTTPSPDEDLVAELKTSGPAFGTSILVRAYAGSTRIHRKHAVFAQGKRIIVVQRLGDVMTVIPQGSCPVTVPDDVLGARIVGAPGHPRLGHLRYRRAEVTDAPTLPNVRSAAPRPGCPVDETGFQIEDHFVDLDTGEYLLGLAQVFRGPASGEPSPAIPLDRFGFDAHGVTVPGCADQLFAWPFPDGE